MAAIPQRVNENEIVWASPLLIVTSIVPIIGVPVSMIAQRAIDATILRLHSRVINESDPQTDFETVRDTTKVFQLLELKNDYHSAAIARNLIGLALCVVSAALGIIQPSGILIAWGILYLGCAGWESKKIGEGTKLIEKLRTSITHFERSSEMQTF